MTRWMLLVVLALSGAGCASLEAAGAPRVERYYGKETTLASLEGKVVVLNYWAHWCGPCRAEVPAFLEVARELRDQPVEFLAVHYEATLGARDQVEAFIRDQPEDFPRYVAYANNTLRRTYPTNVFPTTYILGKDGKPFALRRGGFTAQMLREAVRAALAR